VHPELWLALPIGGALLIGVIGQASPAAYANKPPRRVWGC